MMSPNVGEFVPIAGKEDTKVTSVGSKRTMNKTRQHHKQGELIRLPLRVRKRRREQVKEWLSQTTVQEERVKRKRSPKMILQSNRIF